MDFELDVKFGAVRDGKLQYNLEQIFMYLLLHLLVIQSCKFTY